MKPAKKSKWVNSVLPGIFLIGISLGGIFSIELVRHGFKILILTTIISIFYLNRSIMGHFEKRKLNKVGIFYGFMSLFLICLSFGIQARQIPFKEFILIIGIGVLIYGLYKKLK